MLGSFGFFLTLAVVTRHVIGRRPSCTASSALGWPRKFVALDIWYVFLQPSDQVTKSATFFETLLTFLFGLCGSFAGKCHG